MIKNYLVENFSYYFIMKNMPFDHYLSHHLYMQTNS